MKVLISKMFAGKFNEDSIGHEIINFYKPENSKSSFIYHPRHGKCSEVDSVVLVGKAEKYAYPVIAIANNVTKDNLEYYEQNLKYGKKKLKDINFLEEKYKEKNNKKDKNYDIKNISYEVEEGCLKIPDKCIYIISKTNKRFTESKQTNRKKELIQAGCDVVVLSEENPQHDGCYCECDDEKNIDLNELINKSKNWKNYPLKKVSEQELDVTYNEDSFLNFIEKGNSEQIYTNMICNILNICDNEIRKEFVKFLIKDKVEENFNFEDIENIQISKEKILKDSKYKGRLDLLISNENFLIVIENKIKSDFNGTFIEDNIKKNQIDKYNNYLNELKNKKHKNAETFIFVLKPNYLDLTNISNDYAVINYKELYSFFSKIKKRIKNRYYSEFLNALAKQSLTTEEEINRRFLNMINK